MAKIRIMAVLRDAKKSFLCAGMAVFLLFGVFSRVSAEDDPAVYTVTVSYSSTDGHEYSLTFDYSDEWLLADPSVYDHKLAQASFGMTVAGFRDRQEDLTHKDENIESFFRTAGFQNYTSQDFHLTPSQDTVATAIASKKTGDVTIIVCVISGNVYQNEWLNNLSIGDEERTWGFNEASQKVYARIMDFIRSNQLEGRLCLWLTGYSRSAAISNITAADATDSGIFESVFAYNFACPRTTKDPDSHSYGNIFNIINPFDPVTLVPFPEWGFSRYGTDLFLTSWETDSEYLAKKEAADAAHSRFRDGSLQYNPQVNVQIHTLLDLFLYMVNSSKSYRDSLEDNVKVLYETRNFRSFFDRILLELTQDRNISNYRWSMAADALDYFMQSAYQNFRGQVFHPKELLWDPAVPLQANLAHEHYDEVYRSWLFSSDDPEEIFHDNHGYTHFTIVGNVDVAVFDEKERFVMEIFRSGSISYNMYDSLVVGDYITLQSPFRPYADHIGDQTFIILPKDQLYQVWITPDKDQLLQYSYIDYDADHVRGSVQYILRENVKAGSLVRVNVDPEFVHELSDAELLEHGFEVVEPWSQDIVYSPSAIIDLENNGIFHPGLLALLTYPVLLAVFVIYLVILTLIGTGKGIKTGAGLIRRRITERKNVSIKHKLSTAAGDVDPAVPSMEIQDHENQ